jgi:hypothetical protein
MISSPVLVTSINPLSARFEPGPQIRSGDSALSLAAMTTEPLAIPAATKAVCDAHVRAYPIFGSFPCWRHAPAVDVARSSAQSLLRS